MFQSIKSIKNYVEYTNPDYAGQGKTILSYQIIDSEFEGDLYKIDTSDCGFVRIIIHEYSKRNLNVAANLKLFYDTQFIHDRSYRTAIITLATHRNVINAYYSHLNFDDYYACLKRHLTRMVFVGKLKA